MDLQLPTFSFFSPFFIQYINLEYMFIGYVHLIQYFMISPFIQPASSNRTDSTLHRRIEQISKFNVLSQKANN